MVKKKSVGRIVFECLNTVFLGLVALCCIIPIIHVIMASISSPALVETSNGLILWPLGKPSLNGFRYRNMLAGFITFTMLFSGGMIPTYMVVRDLGMIDTYWSMLIPGALSVFNIIIMRTGIQEIPDSLEESARIDGAGELTILFRIILPLCKATFAVIILFITVHKWNEWFPALLYLNKEDKYPLQMILRNILIAQTAINNGTVVSADSLNDQMELYQVLMRYCSIVISILPILCIYPFVQRYFVNGVMIGSIKG